jgi:hypothetical protein
LAPFMIQNPNIQGDVPKACILPNFLTRPRSA